MNDAPRPACVPAGHIEPLVPAPPRDRREPVADRLAEIVRLAQRVVDSESVGQPSVDTRAMAALRAALTDLKGGGRDGQR